MVELWEKAKEYGKNTLIFTGNILEKYWSTILALICFALFFIIEGKMRAIYTGFALIFLAISTYKYTKTESHVFRKYFVPFLYGFLGILSIIFYYSIDAGIIVYFVVFIVLIIFLLFPNDKVAGIYLLASIPLVILSTYILKSFIMDFMNILFFKIINYSQILYMIFIPLIILISFLSIFINLFYFLGNRFNIDRLKRNFFYIGLSLAMLTLIFICGFMGTRSLYMNDYPFSVVFSPSSENLSVFLENCGSASNKYYFFDDDQINCDIRLNAKKNYSYGKMWVQGRYGENNWSPIKNEDFNFNTNNKLNVRLDYNVNDYQILILLNATNETSDRFSTIIHTEVLNKEAYQDKINKRIGIIVAILTLALFSVFSAVANLKKILD